MIVLINLVDFTNDKYKLLKFLYDNQIEIKNNKYIVLSQQEMADMLQTAKLKVNLTIKEFKECGFIENYKGKRGKYVFTDKRSRILRFFENK